MKRIYLFTIIITLLYFTSCNDSFLDRAPYNSVGSGNMWTTENLTDMGVTGVYQILRADIPTSGGSTHRELYQLDQYSSSAQCSAVRDIVAGSVTPGAGLFSNTWKDLYEGIHRANDAIRNIPLKSPVGAEKKARLVAECKFLRAFFYFRLVQAYKEVPVYLEPVSDDECIKPKETEAFVWGVVIDDLTFCINEQNLPLKYGEADGNFGRVTKGAAYALRGKAYLYTGEYAKAVEDFKKVEESGYALWQGSNYAQLFKESNERSSEMIFSIQNIGVEGYGSATTFYLGTRSVKSEGWNTYSVKPNLVDKYENIDGTIFNWDDIIPGYSAMAPVKREVYFLRDTVGVVQMYTNAGMSSENAAARAATIRGFVNNRLRQLDDVKHLYLPAGNEARIKAAYEGRDPRLKATVITPYSEFKGVTGGVDNTVTCRWPSSGRTLEAGPLGDLRTDQQSFFAYHPRKWVAEGTSETPHRSYGPIDFPILRYADILLMRAEALARDGKYTEALPFVNAIRNRVNMPEFQLTDPSKATYVSGADDMFQKIQDERQREFLFEGITYFDELRWGTFKKNVFEICKGKNSVWGETIGEYSYLGDQLYTWPTPTQETQMNTNLTQTAGWTY